MSISAEQRALLLPRLAAIGVKVLGYNERTGDLLVQRFNNNFIVHRHVTPERFDAMTKAPALRNAIGDISRDHPTTAFISADFSDFAGIADMTLIKIDDEPSKKDSAGETAADEAPPAEA